MRTYRLSYILLLVPAWLLADIRVIEESAIPYAGFLSKAEFDRRFPGETVADPSALDSGWYVIYEHESLSYYFGPILLRSTGEDYLDELTGIVEAAVEQRPSIEEYRLELSYEPTESAGDVSGNGASEPEADSRQGSGSPPPRKPSIFDFFRRLFGF